MPFVYLKNVYNNIVYRIKEEYEGGGGGGDKTTFNFIVGVPYGVIQP